MRPESALFYQQARETFAGRGRNRAQSHAALHLLVKPRSRKNARAGFFFQNDFLILDEAHTVEQVASTTHRYWRLAIRTALDNPTAI
jgi:Cu2+-containing amine oxidase